jgi:hypothetical protein
LATSIVGGIPMKVHDTCPRKPLTNGSGGGKEILQGEVGWGTQLQPKLELRGAGSWIPRFQNRELGHPAIHGLTSFFPCCYDSRTNSFIHAFFAGLPSTLMLGKSVFRGFLKYSRRKPSDVPDSGRFVRPPWLPCAQAAWPR